MHEPHTPRFTNLQPAHAHASVHPHHHGAHSHHHGEARTRMVLAITLLTMIIEIIVGTWSGSMALLSDGWHMGTHAAALAVSVIVYGMARKYRNHPQYAESTPRFEALGAYTSALGLGLVSLALVYSSTQRLLHPLEIQYGVAVGVAILGLLVNGICAWILDASAPEHAHDLNLRSAYLHVLADALTSLLAIIALALGWWLGIAWADPAVGFLAAIMVGRWSIQLIRQSAVALLQSKASSWDSSL